MKKEALAQFNNPDLILIGFLIFFIGFLFICINTYRKKNKSTYEKLAQLPLNDEPEALK